MSLLALPQEILQAVLLDAITSSPQTQKFHIMEDNICPYQRPAQPRKETAMSVCLTSKQLHSALRGALATHLRLCEAESARHEQLMLLAFLARARSFYEIQDVANINFKAFHKARSLADLHKIIESAELPEDETMNFIRLSKKYCFREKLVPNMWLQSWDTWYEMKAEMGLSEASLLGKAAEYKIAHRKDLHDRMPGLGRVTGYYFGEEIPGFEEFWLPIYHELEGDTEIAPRRAGDHRRGYVSVVSNNWESRNLARGRRVRQGKSVSMREIRALERLRNEFSDAENEDSSSESH